MASDLRIQCSCGQPLYLSGQAKCKRCGTQWRLIVSTEAYVRSEGEWEEVEVFCEHCGKGLLHDQARCIDVEDGIYECRDEKGCAKRRKAGAGIGCA